MENKDPQTEKILESIKAELSSIRAELKASLKTEIEGIRDELKAEMNNTKSGGVPTQAPPPSSAGRIQEDEDEDEDEDDDERDEDTQRRHHRGPRFGHDFPFESDIAESVRGAIDNALGSVSGRESERITKEFKLTDFTAIELGGAFLFEIVRADSFSVSITAEEEFFRNLDVSKHGGTLHIGHSRHIGWRAQLSRPKATITLPLLKELRASGASKGRITGFKSEEPFKLEVSGAVTLTGDISTGDARLEISGASHLELAGSAKNVVLEVSGASHVDLSSFSVHDAAVRTSGASHAALKVTGKLDARTSGASHFNCIGNPTMGNIRTSGASHLNQE